MQLLNYYCENITVSNNDFTNLKVNQIYKTCSQMIRLATDCKSITPSLLLKPSQYTLVGFASQSALYLVLLNVGLLLVI